MENIFALKRPPRRVWIMGHRVAVRVVPLLEDEGMELLGAWNPETKTIFLLRGCDWRSVLLHEICHAILSFAGASEGITMNKEESIVLALEHGLGPIIFRKR